MKIKQKRKSHPNRSQFKYPMIFTTLLILLILGVVLGNRSSAPQPISITDECEGVPARLYVDWINYGKPNAQTELYAVCIDGQIAKLSNTPGRENSPQLSPDKQWIAYDRADPGEPAQVWVMRIDGSDPRQITMETIGANVVHWFNNTHLEYSRKTIDSCTLYRNNIQGSFEVTLGDCP